MRGASASHAVLTALAPIASRQSSVRCTISIGPTVVPSMTRTSMSRAPPPSSTRTGSVSSASASSSSREHRTSNRADQGSATSSTWICPIISAGVAVAWKPPPARASLAARDAPATTDGSSMTIGTNTSRPLIRKLTAIPSGSACTPITFSIISSACARSSPIEPRSVAVSSEESPAQRATCETRSSNG